MTTDLHKKADARFAAALAATGARDPRDYYRSRLRDLKQSNPEGYAGAVAYYQSTVVPSIAEQDADPLAAWREFGLLLARLTSPGRAVAVDPGGRSRPLESPGKAEDMILHLPDARNARALLVGLPPEPSAAQMATHNWLVLGHRATAGEAGRGQQPVDKPA